MTSIHKIMANSVQTSLPSLLIPLVIFFMLQCSNGDISSDQKECTDQLVGLATCLPYVQGSAKAPTPDCCSGLKDVLSKSPKCLCVLIKDRDDPQLGIKINVSLALALPVACDRPVKLSECPKLLKLPPTSPDAQIFTQPQKAAQGNTSKTTAAEGNMTSANQNSGSMSSSDYRHHFGRGKWWMIEMLAAWFLFGLLLPIVVLI